MVGVLAICTAGCASTTSSVSSRDAAPPIPAKQADQPPELVGGHEALYEKLQYPDEARANGISGRVVLEIVVGVDGDVRSAHVADGAHRLLNQEALRVISRVRYRPAIKDGQPVAVETSVPIRFQVR
jgi:protein TonB